jgi:hypothetical protein
VSKIDDKRDASGIENTKQMLEQMGSAFEGYTIYQL